MPSVRLPLSALLRALALVLVGCRDEAPARAASLALVGSAERILAVGDELHLAVECRDAHGALLPTYRVQWIDDSDGAFVVRGNGPHAVVKANAPTTSRILAVCSRRDVGAPSMIPYGGYPPPALWGAFYIDAVNVGEAAWALDLAGDTLDLRAPSPADSVSGVVRVLTARGVSAAGSVLGTESFAWSSDAPSVATVSARGLVRAISPGWARITVTRDASAQSVSVRVSESAPTIAWDVALVDAHWTQGAQDSLQRVPMVRGGRAAVVNVLAFATPGAAPRNVLLRVFDATNALIWADTTALSPDTVDVPTFANPSAQFLVPRPVLHTAARWTVTIDSVGGPDAAIGNDRIPRTGEATLHATTVDPLRLRLVPIQLAKHANVLAPVNAATIVHYDSIARIRQPLADVIVTLAPKLVTQADYFTEGGDVREGDTPFFLRVLEEIDQRRLAHGSASGEHWIGIIPKPATATSSRWGGFAYIPTDPASIGPLTRSAVVLGHDWYATPVSAGFLVSHELGHNFGRRHAPCGGASNVDPWYPVPNGALGSWVHHTTSWERNDSTFAATIPPTGGDVMSYCSSGFLSPYTTLGILQFRAPRAATLQSPRPVEPILAVRGVVDGSGIRLGVPWVTEGVATTNPAGTGIDVELLAEDGRVIVRVGAVSGRTGHDETAIPFAAMIPVSAAEVALVTRVRVRAGGHIQERDVAQP